MTSHTVLGIETSCDETAAAVLRLEDGHATILSEIVRSQVEDHAPYGGVVPEIAARAHADIADQVVAKAIGESGLKLSDMDAVAATSGPGLIGGVMVGMMTGKALALAVGKPFIPVNHLEGHALSPRLADPTLEFPYLLLLVSGGHCQFLSAVSLSPPWCGAWFSEASVFLLGSLLPVCSIFLSGDHGCGMRGDHVF